MSKTFLMSAKQVLERSLYWREVYVFPPETWTSLRSLREMDTLKRNITKTTGTSDSQQNGFPKHRFPSGVHPFQVGYCSSLHSLPHLLSIPFTFSPLLLSPSPPIAFSLGLPVTPSPFPFLLQGADKPVFRT